MGTRSNMFANIENTFKVSSKEDIRDIALGSAGDLLAAMEAMDDSAKFGALILGARFGAIGDKMLNYEERELIDAVFGGIWTGPIEEIYDMVSVGLVENDYELLTLFTEMGNEVAIPLLYYILSFAYIDGYIEDDVADRLDSTFGMNLLVGFMNSGLEEVPAPGVFLNDFEATIVSWFELNDTLHPLVEIQEQFSYESAEKIQKTLDDLVDKGVLFGGANIIGNMYGLVNSVNCESISSSFDMGFDDELESDYDSDQPDVKNDDEYNLQLLIDAYKDELVAEMMVLQGQILNHEKTIKNYASEIKNAEIKLESCKADIEEKKKQELAKKTQQEAIYRQEINDYRESIERNTRKRNELIHEAEELKKQADECSIFKRALKKDLLNKVDEIQAQVDQLDEDTSKSKMLIRAIDHDIRQGEITYADTCKKYDSQVEEIKESIGIKSEGIVKAQAKITQLTENIRDSESLWNNATERVRKEEEIRLQKEQSKTKEEHEREILKQELYDALKEMSKPVTISELQELSYAPVVNLSNQKLSMLFNYLVKDGLVEKTIENKKSYFSIIPKPEKPNTDKQISEYFITVLNDMDKPVTIEDMINTDKFIAMLSADAIDRIIKLLVKNGKLTQTYVGDTVAYTV